MLTIEPRCNSSIPRSTCFEQRKVPVRFTAIMRFQSSRLSRCAGASWAMPATFSSTSMVPKRWVPASTSASTCASELMSVLTKRHSPPHSRISRSVWSPPGSFTSAAMTRAPSRANSCAVSFPIAIAAPVTRATRPRKRIRLPFVYPEGVNITRPRVRLKAFNSGKREDSGRMAQRTPSNRIVKPDVEVIADDGNLCGEGPHWDERENALYWTDIDGARFYRFLWHERRRELLHEGFIVNGFCMQQGGGFLATSSQGAWLWQPGADPLLVAGEAEGQECRLNDCLADPEGRVYSGSYHLNEDGTSPPSYLFRIDTDGSVHIVDEGISFSNGLAFSPDCSTLYFTDLVARCIYAYDWRRNDGALTN